MTGWIVKVKSYDVAIQGRSDLRSIFPLFAIFYFQEILYGSSLKFYSPRAFRYSVHFEPMMEVGGGTPYDSLYREAPSERAKVYERVGKSAIYVFKGPFIKIFQTDSP